MPDSLHRLVYVSRDRLEGGTGAVARSLHDIVDVARRRNAAVGLTGALLHSAGRFAQVLEGPRDAVLDAFERIRRDRRHDDVRRLRLARIDARDFPGWAMVRAESDTALPEPFAVDGALGPDVRDPERVTAFIRGRVEEADRRLSRAFGVRVGHHELR